MAPISGKNGLITLSGTKKPSYYAYKLLAKLIGDIIKTGDFLVDSAGDNGKPTSMLLLTAEHVTRMALDDIEDRKSVV